MSKTERRYKREPMSQCAFKMPTEMAESMWERASRMKMTGSEYLRKLVGDDLGRKMQMLSKENATKTRGMGG